MKKLIMFVLLCISCETVTNNNGTSNSIVSQLNIGSVTSIQVQQYDSLYSQHFFVRRTITSKDTIQMIVDLLRKLPGEGEIMVKFGSGAQYKKLIFTEENTKKDTLEIIDNRIKTPKTSFYAPVRVEENTIVSLIVN